MSASPKRRAVLVGLFLTVGALMLSGGILTVGDLHDTFTPRITVSAVFDEVNGLQAGDNIWYSGLKVGVVRGLAFTPEAKVRVELKIDRRATLHIHRDTLAKIGSDGLIGSTIVVLYEGTPAAPALAEGDVLAVGTTVSTEQIMAMLHENGDNILAITTDLKEITRRLSAGEGTVGGLLKDDALFLGVAESVASLSTAAVNAKSLTADLAQFTSTLDVKGTLVNDLATDRTTYPKLVAAVDDLGLAGQRASDLVDGLARGTTDASTPVGALLHDAQAGADLKATLTHLNRGSRLLSEDLEAIQHNFLLRGFFKKREKAAAEKGPHR